jgi:hypothetical protein
MAWSIVPWRDYRAGQPSDEYHPEKDATCDSSACAKLLRRAVIVLAISGSLSARRSISSSQPFLRRISLIRSMVVVKMRECAVEPNIKTAILIEDTTAFV